MVLPLVPVTPTVSRRSRRVAVERRGGRRHRRADARHRDLRDAQVQRALDDQRHRAAGDRVGGEVVAVAGEPGHAEEQRPGLDGAVVVREAGDLDVAAPSCASGMRSPSRIARRAYPRRTRQRRDAGAAHGGREHREQESSQDPGDVQRGRDGQPGPGRQRVEQPTRRYIEREQDLASNEHPRLPPAACAADLPGRHRRRSARPLPRAASSRGGWRGARAGSPGNWAARDLAAGSPTSASARTAATESAGPSSGNSRANEAETVLGQLVPVAVPPPGDISQRPNPGKTVACVDQQQARELVGGSEAGEPSIGDSTTHRRRTGTRLVPMQAPVQLDHGQAVGMAHPIVQERSAVGGKRVVGGVVAEPIAYHCDGLFELACGHEQVDII